MNLFLCFAMIEQKDCYTGASIEYSYNVKTADVTLQPNPEANCVFPSEVYFEIIFHDGMPSQAFVHNNFSFPGTETVLMTGIEVDITRDILFAYMNISSLSRYTMVKVDSFGVYTSLMDRCFDSTGDQFQLSSNYYAFNITLTDACYAEIMQSSSYYISFGAYAATHSINITEKQGCYVQEVDDHLLHCEFTNDFTYQVYEPFLQMVVIFSMTISGIEYTSSYTFYNLLQGKFSQIYQADNRLSISKTTVFVYAMPDTQTAYQLEDSVRGIDKVALRYLIRKISDGTTYTHYFELTDLYMLRYAFIFQCTDDDCKEAHEQAMEQPEAYRYAFDVTMFSDDTLRSFLYQEQTPIVSCFESTVAKRIGYKFRFEVISGDKCQMNLAEPLSFSIVGLDNLKPDPLLFTINYELDSFNGTFTLDIDEIPQCTTEQFYDDNVGIILKFYQNDYIDYIYNSQFVEGDYKTTYITVFSFGIVIVLVCLWDSINKMLLFRRVMKASRKQR